MTASNPQQPARENDMDAVPKDAWTNEIYWAADNARLCFLRDTDCNDHMSAIAAAVDAAFAAAGLPNPTSFLANKDNTAATSAYTSLRTKKVALAAKVVDVEAENARLRAVIRTHARAALDPVRKEPLHAAGDGKVNLSQAGRP